MLCEAVRFFDEGREAPIADDVAEQVVGLLENGPGIGGVLLSSVRWPAVAVAAADPSEKNINKCRAAASNIDAEVAGGSFRREPNFMVVVASSDSWFRVLDERAPLCDLFAKFGTFTTEKGRRALVSVHLLRASPVEGGSTGHAEASVDVVFKIARSPTFTALLEGEEVDKVLLMGI